MWKPHCQDLLKEQFHRFEGPHTFLKRNMVECELAWEQCRNIDRLLLEIMEEQEAASKEEYDQLDYKEKIYELREAYEKYLENRKTEPSSVAGDVKDTKEAAREIAKPVEKAVKENSETKDPMENTHYTKRTEKVHIGREPFQSTVKGNRSAAEEAMSDDWIRQLASPTLKEPEEVTVLAQNPSAVSFQIRKKAWIERTISETILRLILEVGERRQLFGIILEDFTKMIVRYAEKSIEYRNAS